MTYIFPPSPIIISRIPSRQVDHFSALRTKAPGFERYTQHSKTHDPLLCPPGLFYAAAGCFGCIVHDEMKRKQNPPGNALYALLAFFLLWKYADSTKKENVILHHFFRVFSSWGAGRSTYWNVYIFEWGRDEGCLTPSESDAVAGWMVRRKW